MAKTILYRFGIFMAGTFLLLPLAAAAPSSTLLVTASDEPIRLIRGTTLYQAAPGVAVENGDIMESANGNAQLELPDAIIMSLAGHTRIHIDKAAPQLEFTLLDGWIKVNARPDAGVPVLVRTPLMQIQFPAGTAIVHAEAGKTEIFAEEGVQQAAPLGPDFKAGQATAVGREMYAQRLEGQAVKVPQRPPREFLAAMPRAFRDSLVPVASTLKNRSLAPTAQAEVKYEDVADWLKSSTSLRNSLVPRFRARLRDPAFRHALDADLGRTPQWKAVLHPPRKTPNRVSVPAS